jgi:hypothetical protein
MKALEQARPQGISFSQMAMRLLLKEVPLSEPQIEALKSAMFQLGNGLWFSRSMVVDDAHFHAFRAQAQSWLAKHGCFSVDRIRDAHARNLRHIASTGDCSAFLQHLGFHVESHRQWGSLCFKHQVSLDEHLAAISAVLAEQVDAADGVLVVDDLDAGMPHLTYKTLNAIRAAHLPDVHESEVAGILCWCRADAIQLPDDFPSMLTTAVDRLEALGEKVSTKNLAFALDLFYGFRFRKEHSLQDNAAFIRLCARHYQGASDIFARQERRAKKKREKPSRRRQRSPNTRFDALGIPVGAVLTFTRKPAVTCTVLDQANQVKYEGKTWSISRLACHLLGVPAANGFWHFSFDGETLLSRRSRFETRGSKTRKQMELFPEPVPESKAKSGVIGLKGQRLAPATWRAFQKADNNPEVAEWERRVENGESLETIAFEKGLKVSTVNEYIVNRRRHFAVCAKNGVASGVGHNV